MQVKIFDMEDEKDLEMAINDFKYQVSSSIYSEEQIYCFSAMIVYVHKG